MIDNLNIAICEDQAVEAIALKHLISAADPYAAIDTFSSGEDLLLRYTPGYYHLIFLDIYMPGLSGIETAAKIRAADENTILAFTTTSKRHTLESYSLNAYKYLLKPLSIYDVRDTVNLSKKLHGLDQNNLLTINKYKDQIALDTIYYIESANHICMIHQEDQTLRCTMTLDELEASLPSPPFFKCHRSYIVNLNYVKEVKRDFIMNNGSRVYIRGKDLKKMQAALKAYRDG